MFKSPIVRSLAVAPLLMGVLATPSLAAGRHSNQCILSTMVESFNAPDTQTVYLRVGVNEFWKLGLQNNCLELPYRLNIGLKVTGTSPWICTPVEATIINHGAGIPHQCPVISMHRLTRDEVAALPKGVKP
ncbi:MAG TPA: DUF6491 family protein [Caulobacteraceae bacterium]|jgi:hypothetical protein